MSRLDRHVSFVQGKLTTSIFIDSMMVAAGGVCIAVGVAVLFNRLLQLSLPHPTTWLAVVGGVAAVAAAVFAFTHRPSAHDAAVEIDRRLALKEKFSTALYARSVSDAFAVAAVRDAERSAENVSLSRKFPLTRPKYLWFALVTVVALGLLWFVPQMDLLGRQAEQRKLAEATKRQGHSKDVVRQALATVNSYPKSMLANRDIQLAKRDLEAMLNRPAKDPEQVGRSAMKALNDANAALKEQIKNSERFATAQNQQRAFSQLETSPDDKGPVADASRAIAKGDFSKAAEQLKQATAKFDKMPPPQQKAAAQQMQQMANQLQKMASDPNRQKELQQKLQQMGASQQQAQQMQQMMQQAAQGNPQAQQQLQQLKKQLQQQMNQGKGASPQQMQQMQQAMKQMQANANTQQTAQQMAQSAQQMAQAMQQAQQGQQGKQGQQSQQSQQAQSGKSQQGQQSQQQQQQAMNNAQQQMQQQMDQMDAIAQDAQQVAAAQQSTDQAAEEASEQASGKPGDGKPGQTPGGGAGATGQWRPGDPNKGGAGRGAGGAGKGGGHSDGITEAPFAMKAEVAHSKDIATGRTLASTFVKAGTVKGEARIGLSQAAASAMKDSTDDVDEQNVSKQSQDVVKQYFETMQSTK